MGENNVPFFSPKKECIFETAIKKEKLGYYEGELFDDLDENFVN